jgi:hypothetical protein
MENVNANGILDTFTGVNGSFTIACSFYVSASGHTSTGVRFYWVGGLGALTIKASLWQATGNGTGSRVVSANGSVNAAGEYTISWAPQTLVPGEQYAVSVWETTGSNGTNIGNVSNSNSPLSFMLKGVMVMSGTAVVYAPLVGNGGGAVVSPFAAYGNGDAYPINISATGFSPVEPVVT